jgi:DnaK suppressor protein
MANHLTQEFIQQQKERLINERAKAVEEIEVLKQDDPFSDPDHANDNAAVDNDVREETGHMTIQAQIEEYERRISDIDRALEKIEKGHYGYCEKSNQPIPQARLELVPEARFLVEPGA